MSDVSGPAGRVSPSTPSAPADREVGPSTPSAPADEKARLFVALELPDDVREVLVGWRSRALSGVSGLRMVRPEDLHATLCFLGSRPAREIDEIAGACGVVAGERAAETRIAEPLWLPPRRPRVLAVRLDDDEGALARVQAVLSTALAAGGWYAPESRPWLAHVTVARVAKNARIKAPSLPVVPGVEFRCSRVTLYRSRLSPSGARYEALRVVELGSRV